MQMSSAFFSDHICFSLGRPKVLPQLPYEIHFPSILSLYLLANVTLFSPNPTFVPFFLFLSVFHPSFSLFLSLPFPLSLPSLLLLPSTVFFILPRLLHGGVSDLMSPVLQPEILQHLFNNRPGRPSMKICISMRHTLSLTSWNVPANPSARNNKDDSQTF